MAKKNYIPVKLQDDNIVDVNEVKNEIVEVKEDNKMIEFAKKHWKKAAVGLGLVGAGILGFVLGKSKDDEEDLDLLEYDSEDDNNDETEEE